MYLDITPLNIVLQQNRLLKEAVFFYKSCKVVEENLSKLFYLLSNKVKKTCTVLCYNYKSIKYNLKGHFVEYV